MYNYIIIDDESLIRKGTQKKLAALEQIVCVGEASNGKEGMELVASAKPDFVILDMQMPVMNGTALLSHLSKEYPDLPLIVISGFKDFDYIKHAISANAIDYILKPFSKEAIQACVLDTIGRLEHRNTIQNQIISSAEEKESAYYEHDCQMLKNLIWGYHTDSTTVSSSRLSFVNETHHMCLITIVYTHAPVNHALPEWLDENGFGDLALYLSSPTNAPLDFLILFMPENSPLSHERLTEQVLDALSGYLKQKSIDSIMGISNTHKDLKQLHEAFLESSAALNCQPLVPSNQKHYFYSEEKEPRVLNWSDQEEFLFRVETGMTEEVRLLTDKLMTWFQKQPDITLQDAKYYCYQLSTQCQSVLNYYLNQNDFKSGSTSMQNVVNHIFSLEELHAYYLQCFLNITDLLKHQSIYAVDDVVEKIQIYMQRNYQKNLTQEFLSCLFYMNRSYLSTLFKNKTGKKFVDYLNDIRIEKAKELLRQSDRKMYQIAKSVGYDNIKYFFRIFKKKEGVTPEQYREGNPCLPED